MDSESHSPKSVKKSDQVLTSWAAFSVTLATFCGLFQYGFALGSVNSAAAPIQKFIRLQHQLRYNETITKEKLDLIWVFLVSAFPLGGLVGCFLVGPAVRKFGKLHPMIFGHSCTVIASLLMGLSGVALAYELIIFGRVVIGIVSSLVGTGIVPQYIVEVSPRRHRGVFGGFLSFCISFSVFISNVLGLEQLLGNDTLWPLLLALNGAPSLVYILLSRFMAESPRTIYLTRCDPTGAENLLKKLRNGSDVTGELELLAEELQQQETNKQMSIFQLIRSRALRLQLFSAFIVAFAQQITGLNGVIIYMNELFVLAGVPRNAVAYCSLGVTALLCMVTIVAISFLDSKGRKPLLVTGLLTEGVSLILLIITVEIQHLASWLPYLSLIFAAMFLVGFATGPGPVTLLCIAEFFPQISRPAALTIGSASLFVGFTITVFAWPYMQSSMGGYAYLPFSVFAITAALYVYFVVPETKGKSFVETQRVFQEKRFGCSSRAGSETIQMREMATVSAKNVQ